MCIRDRITDATGAGTILDNDAAPLVTINDVSKNEGNRNTTPINFTVSLSTVSGKAIYVDYVTADGTATTAGSDYFATSGTLYIAPGATTALINTSLRGDTKKEANETFYVNLTGAADGTISDNQGVGTIVNDDGGRAPEPPKLRIGNASIVEGNSGTTLLVFTVSLSAPSDGTVRVEYATSDGRAKTSDNDYVAARGQLVFALGESTKTISVVIKGDTKKERDESFYVDLFNADNASIADARARGRIQNDDRR